MRKRMPKCFRRNYMLLILLLGIGNLAYVLHKLFTSGFYIQLVYNMLMVVMCGFMIQNVDALYNMGSESE